MPEVRCTCDSLWNLKFVQKYNFFICFWPTKTTGNIHLMYHLILFGLFSLSFHPPTDTFFWHFTRMHLSLFCPKMVNCRLPQVLSKSTSSIVFLVRYNLLSSVIPVSVRFLLTFRNRTIWVLGLLSKKSKRHCLVNVSQFVIFKCPYNNLHPFYALRLPCI